MPRQVRWPEVIMDDSGHVRCVCGHWDNEHHHFEGTCMHQLTRLTYCDCKQFDATKSLEWVAKQAFEDQGEG